jgi:hypothetical protein
MPSRLVSPTLRRTAVEEVMDGREAFQKCEELFVKYGISAEDQGWFILAFESLCVQAFR